MLLEHNDDDNGISVAVAGVDDATDAGNGSSKAGAPGSTQAIYRDSYHSHQLYGQIYYTYIGAITLLQSPYLCPPVLNQAKAIDQTDQLCYCLGQWSSAYLQATSIDSIEVSLRANPLLSVWDGSYWQTNGL